MFLIGVRGILIVLNPGRPSGGHMFLLMNVGGISIVSALGGRILEECH